MDILKWTIGFFFICAAVVCADPLHPPLDEFSHGVVGIGITATKIPATPLRGREFITIKNVDSTKTIYIGSSTVTADETSTGGDQLLPSERAYMEFSSDLDIYGIVSGGTANVTILEAK